jgi:hypothetical protein
MIELYVNKDLLSDISICIHVQYNNKLLRFFFFLLVSGSQDVAVNLEILEHYKVTLIYAQSYTPINNQFKGTYPFMMKIFRITFPHMFLTELGILN